MLPAVITADMQTKWNIAVCLFVIFHIVGRRSCMLPVKVGVGIITVIIKVRISDCACFGMMAFCFRFCAGAGRLVIPGICIHLPNAVLAVCVLCERTVCCKKQGCGNKYLFHKADLVS